MAMTITSVTPIGEIGGMTLAKVRINPDTTDASETIALAAYCKDEAIPLSPPNYIEAMSANCYTGQVFQNSSTKTSVDVRLWKAGGTAADTAVLDFEFIVLFKDSEADLATL
jgi:hypothetical protein